MMPVLLAVMAASDKSGGSDTLPAAIITGIVTITIGLFTFLGTRRSIRQSDAAAAKKAAVESTSAQAAGAAEKSADWDRYSAQLLQRIDKLQQRMDQQDLRIDQQDEQIRELRNQASEANSRADEASRRADHAEHRYKLALDFIRDLLRWALAPAGPRPSTPAEVETDLAQL